MNSIIQKPPEIHEGIRDKGPKEKPMFMYFRTSGTFFTFFLGSLALKLLESGNRREKRLQKAENERIVTELSYLKHQISPHFLFNSLNSVYALAVKQSEQTPDVVLKLSELMRYVLDEKQGKQVRLEEEIEHIKKYIELQKLRLFDVVKVNFESDKINPDLKIEPMLLIPFVENAFKYGVSYKEECSIRFGIKTSENLIIFTSVNKIYKLNDTEHNTGIGIKNVKRRLDLLYPGNYKLEIKEDDLFQVNLRINFKS